VQSVFGISLDLPIHERFLQVPAFVGAASIGFDNLLRPLHFFCLRCFSQVVGPDHLIHLCPPQLLIQKRANAALSTGVQ
jgi:hypothetical protein